MSDIFGPGDRVAKDANGKEIDRFNGKQIAGWWIEGENPNITHSVTDRERKNAAETIESIREADSSGNDTDKK